MLGGAFLCCGDTDRPDGCVLLQELPSAAGIPSQDGYFLCQSPCSLSFCAGLNFSGNCRVCVPFRKPWDFLLLGCGFLETRVAAGAVWRSCSGQLLLTGVQRPWKRCGRVFVCLRNAHAYSSSPGHKSISCSLWLRRSNVISS